MTRRRGPVALLTIALFALPAPAADKKKDPGAQTTTDADYQALLDAKTVTGKLLSVGGTDKSLSLRVDYQILEPKPNAGKGQGKAMQHLLHEQQAIMRTRNPWVRAQKLQQFETDVIRQQSRAVNSAFKVVGEHKDFDLDSSPTVVVRQAELPAQYDDKGNLKKYTAAELKELKGKNPDLPGYTAEFDNLTVGQTVRVTLAKPKADKDKPKDKDAPEDKRPVVSMIVIVADAPQADAPKGKKNNK